MTRSREFDGMQDFHRLKAQSQWNFSLLTYIESRGSIELAVAFADLFWPEFEIREGYLLRSTGLRDEDLLRWISSTNGDRERVERALNLLHVSDIVPGDAGASDEMLRFLATTIAEMWRARLQQLYPERTVVVRAELADAAGPTVICFQAQA